MDENQYQALLPRLEQHSRREAYTPAEFAEMFPEVELPENIEGVYVSEAHAYVVIRRVQSDGVERLTMEPLIARPVAPEVAAFAKARKIELAEEMIANLENGDKPVINPRTFEPCTPEERADLIAEYKAGLARLKGE